MEMAYTDGLQLVGFQLVPVSVSRLYELAISVRKKPLQNAYSCNCTARLLA